MKKIFVAILLLLGVIVKAQDTKVIEFQNRLTWSQIKEKAKNEKKYIFMDGFTTWCLPCRVMSNEIFPQPNVVNFFNTNFINVAVQFDVTKNDNEEVRRWYQDAKSLLDSYKINSYPTYLFFNPDGELVHKVLGASPSAEDFISKAKIALNPDMQFYTLKRKYEAGKRETDFLLLLINAGQLADERDFTPLVINEYLATQNDLLTKINLKLITVATLKITDPGFSILRNHADKADEIVGNGKSAAIVNTILFDEVVLPYLRDNGKKNNYGGGMIVYSGKINENVNWSQIKEKLNVEYSDLSEKIVMAAKPIYYEWLKNWPKFIESVSEYGNTLSNDKLNSYAWVILSNCESQQYIDSALAWSKKTLTGEDPKKVLYSYTYSNLLYKSGKKEEAIKFLAEAVKLSGEVDGDLAILLNKIKKGEKTW